MTCGTCGFENPEAMQFCGQCGGALANLCPRCSFENPPGFRFCGSCGESLAERSTELPPVHRELRAYTPPHLAERILESRSALEGEHKQVTVLFADVKGSLELSHNVDAEEWHQILDRFFMILSEGVHRFEGTINQFTGDGIMALFGAPLAHEDHARRACYAGLHLMTQLRAYGNDLRLRRGIDFSVRMGLNSGSVVVGKIGDDLRMDYTAQGPIVGLAARIEQLAEPGSVYLTEATAELVRGYFELERIGKFDLRGSDDLVQVHRLVGLGPLRTRFDLSRSRGFSRFVGRRSEMAILDSALEAAAAGNGQVVGVVAEAGIGKSRLCYEFAERCRANEIPVRKTHGVAHGTSIPFLPFFELLREFFEIVEADSAQTARNKIAGVLLMLERGFDEVLPLVFEFLGVPDPENPLGPLGPEVREEQLQRVVRRLIQAGSERQAQVILIEDLHWVDPGTEAFISTLVEAVPGTRTLLLMNFRPEYQGEWTHRSFYRQVPLLPLGPEALKALLKDLLGEHESLGGLAELISDRTRGNPFFVEEVVQSLVQAGMLGGRKGAHVLHKPISELRIPESVRSVLAARIDRLGDPEKRLLQTASVIGRRVTKELLQRVAELKGNELDAALFALVRHEFLNEKALYPEQRYAFKHPLTREVAYDSQLVDRRRTTHGNVARALAGLYPEQLEERAGLIAYHWEEAGQSLQAASWYRRAAEWTGLGHADESLSHWQKVREMADLAAGSVEADGLGARARATILYISARIGAPLEDMEALHREAADLARQSQNDALLAQIESSYWLYHYSSSGVVDDSLKPLREAVALADRADHLGLRMLTRMNLYFCCGFSGRITEGLEVNQACLELSRDDPSAGAKLFGYLPRTAFLFGRVWLLSWAGRIDECAAPIEELRSTAGDEGNWVHGQTAPSAESMLAWIVGDAKVALDHAREAAAASAEFGAQGVLNLFNHHVLGRALMLSEEWSEGARVLEQTIGRLKELRIYRWIEGGCLANLARCYAELGRIERAATTAEEAVRIATRNGWGFECDARIVRARVLGLAEGASARARIEADLARAEELIEVSGAASRRPLVLEERAILAGLLGNASEHRSLLLAAQQLHEEMGASFRARRIAAAL